MKRIGLLITVLLISITAIQAQERPPFKYGANPDDSIRCIENLNAFRTYYQQKDYPKAYGYWQGLVSECPASWSALYSYCQTMFDNLIKAETDSARKEVLIDSLLWSYRVRHIYMPENFTEGSGLGLEAYNLMRYRARVDYEKAHELFIKSIDLDKEKSRPNILDFYMKTAVVMTKMKKDTTFVIEAYERASEPIDIAIENALIQYEKQTANLQLLDSALAKGEISQAEYGQKFKASSEDTMQQKKLIDNYKITQNNLEIEFTPYAPCPVLEKVYATKLADNKENMNVIGKIVRTMSKSGCTDSPVFVEALELYHAQNPVAFSAFMMGNYSLKGNELDKAIAYYQQAVDLYETNESKVQAYYRMALAYQLKNEYSKARSACYDALKLNPNFGNAYILIGKLYSWSSSQCSRNNELLNATSWAAADKFNRAIAVDPSCASEARSELSKLKYPEESEKHMRGLKPGDSYRVECWIQENTTVR